MRLPRILITRTRHQASALGAQLETLGAETILIPTIEVVAPTSFAALDAAIADLSTAASDFDCVIFTSANAVQAAADRAHAQSAQLHPRSIAAIGSATAKAIEQVGIASQSGEVLLPSQYVAESLAAALIAQSAGTPKHYLLIRAEEARDVIPVTLEAAGHRVTIAAAYRNITPPGTIEALRSIFTQPADYPDIITFTSSSTAQNLITLLSSIGKKVPQGVALASIGPITSATLRDLGYQPTFEAAEPTIDSLVAAIAKHLNLSRPKTQKKSPSS